MGQAPGPRPARRARHHPLTAQPAASTSSAFTDELGGASGPIRPHHGGMPTPDRFKFTATLVVAVLAVVLTLWVTENGTDADAPTRMAGQLPPPQR